MRALFTWPLPLVLPPKGKRVEDHMQWSSSDGRQKGEAGVPIRQIYGTAASPFSLLHSFTSFCFLFIFIFAQQVPRTAALTEEDDDDYYASYEADEDDDEGASDRWVAVSRQERGTGAYYDFVINEYSYKLWAAFMIYDLVCVFYGCLVATYFAEVNTLSPTPAFDYDYLAKRSAFGVEEEVLHPPPAIDQEVQFRAYRSASSTPPPNMGERKGGKQANVARMIRAKRLKKR